MTFRKRALYVNYLKIYYSYYVYTMKKYTYCFGCDGKFGGSDGIASARRSSYFDLADDPEVSSEDLSAIEHFYTWNRKPLTTPLCWDCSLFRVLGYSMKYDDKRND